MRRISFLNLSPIQQAVRIVSNSASLLASLKTNILGTKGNGTPTFTRSSGATVIDHEGIVRVCKTGESRMTGYRRVENFILNSETFTDDIAWQKATGATVTPNQVGMDGLPNASLVTMTQASSSILITNGSPSMKAGSLGLFAIDIKTPSGPQYWILQIKDFTGSIVLGAKIIQSTASWQRFYVLADTVSPSDGTMLLVRPSNGATTTTEIRSAYFGRAQVENVGGQSIKMPSEYVPIGANVVGRNYGSELIVNGDGSNGSTGWVLGANWAVSGGSFSRTTSSGFTNLQYQTPIFTIGKTYLVELDITALSGSLKIFVGSGSTAPTVTTTGRFSQLITHAGDTWLYIQATNASTTVTVDNISVRECLFLGANVDGVQYFDTRLDGRPIHEAFGPEQVGNSGGPFTSTSGFSVVSSGTVTGGIQSVVGTALRIQNDNSGTNYGLTQTSISCIIGRTYEVAVQRIGGTGVGYVTVGTGITGGTLNNILANVTTSVCRFVATSTTHYIGLQAGASNAGHYFDFGAVSVRELKPLNGLGIELSTPTNFNFNSGVSNSFGTISFNLGSGTFIVYQDLPSNTLVQGRNYLVTADVVSTISVQPYVGNTAGLPIVNGKLSSLITAGSSQRIMFNTQGAGSGTISNISFREVVTPAGLLHEPQRTNLALYSQDYSNASWNKSRCTVSTSASAPDGTDTFGLLTCNTTNANGFYLSQSVTVPSPTTISYSTYMKKGTSNFALLQITDSTYNNGVNQWVNLSTGLIASSTSFGTGWSKLNATIDPPVNGVYRVKVTSSNPAVTSAVVAIYPSVSGDGAYGGTTGDIGYLWGVQLEAGSSPTSYIPTTSTSVVRSADSLNMPVNVNIGPTNILTYSNNITQSGAWNMSAATGVGNLLKPDTTNSIHRVAHQSVTIASGTQYTWATRASPSGYRYLYINGAAGVNTGQATFDLQNGVVSGSNGGIPSIYPVGDGSYMCCVTATSSSTTSGTFLQVNNAGFGSDTTFVGDGTSGIYCHESGLFQGAWSASQIIAAGGIPVTAGNQNALSQGTMVMTLSMSGIDDTTRYPGVCLRGPNTQNSIAFCADPSGNLFSFIRSNNVQSGSVQNVTSMTPNVQYRVAVSWNNGRVAYSVNGSVPTVVSRDMPLSINTFYSSVDFPWLGVIQSPKVYSIPFNDTQLKNASIS